MHRNTKAKKQGKQRSRKAKKQGKAKSREAGKAEKQGKQKAEKQKSRKAEKQEKQRNRKAEKQKIIEAEKHRSRKAEKQKSRNSEKQESIEPGTQKKQNLPRKKTKINSRPSSYMVILTFVAFSAFSSRPLMMHVTFVQLSQHVSSECPDELHRNSFTDFFAWPVFDSVTFTRS